MSLSHTKVSFDLHKLTGYVLNPAHPEGKHKARVFTSVLGLTTDDAEWLRDAILDALTTVVLHAGVADRHGQRYTADVLTHTSTGSATVRTAWIVRSGDPVLHFVTCFVR